MRQVPTSFGVEVEFEGQTSSCTHGLGDHDAEVVYFNQYYVLK